MADSVDLQDPVVGGGFLLAVAVLVYGAVVSETIAGIETTVAATWVFAVTFAVLAAVHASVGQYDLTLGHGGAAVGWLFVLLGSTGQQVVLGLVLLVLSGSYIAIRTLRRRRDGSEEQSEDA
jgi:steroid 5-alpha reductase family enzyme